MSHDRVLQFTQLKRKTKSEEALTLLKRLASQVLPILTNRNWTIQHLCEFFPTNPNLLGTNLNHGLKISLRLRPHYDDTQFLEYEEILGTLLHEMAHIIRSPHDAQFYKILEELKKETETLMASGYSGQGFYSKGQVLGTQSLPSYLSKQAAANAAEKRLKLNKLCPPGGHRLGGSTSTMTPAQRAADAAERRLRDQVWCGSDTTTDKQPIKRSGDTDSTPGIKKTRVTIDLTNDVSGDSWTCPACTFINNPHVLVCNVCLTENTSDNHWTCPQCTLRNNKNQTACTACHFIH